MAVQISPPPLTGRLAAQHAAELLYKAEAALDPDRTLALCGVADGWRRLAETLEDTPSLATDG